MAEPNYIEEFIAAIKQEPSDDNLIYSAVVSKVDRKGVVWVRVAGSETETPTTNTASEVRPGDTVNVEWRNNKLYISGNRTNPSAGVERVNGVEKTANKARNDAASAILDAERAHKAADDAERDANSAKKSAMSASQSANTALIQLSTVEDVVGTLNWITEHGAFEATQDTTVDPNKRYYERLYDYVLTQDTAIDPNKTYYTRTGQGTELSPYVYSAVSNPTIESIDTYYEYAFTGSYEYYPIDDGNPHSLGLYELTGVDEAVANYIGTHLALTDSGLWVAGDVNSDYRILLSPQGMIVYGPQGIVSQFGENITFSSDSAQRIGGNNSYIEFDPQTGKLNIVADDIHIGEVDAGASLDDQKQKLDELTGYVDINPLEGYIRVGKKDADSYVQIDGDGKVSINIEGTDVAYMSGERFYAPSAVVTNLYMKTELNGDEKGEIGWVMRSNGHLSLKRIK